MEQENWGDLEEGRLNGLYADSFRIGHDAYKFVLDFGQNPSGKVEFHFHTRVIMGPNDAKAFFKTLAESIGEYDERFGLKNSE